MRLEDGHEVLGSFYRMRNGDIAPEHRDSKGDVGSSPLLGAKQFDDERDVALMHDTCSQTSRDDERPLCGSACLTQRFVVE